MVPVRSGVDGDRRRRRLGARVAVLKVLVVVVVAASVSLMAHEEQPPPATKGQVGPTPQEQLRLMPCTKQERPTRDLNTLVSRLRPGDVACLAAGAYGERATRSDWRSSGTPDKPIQVRALGPGEVQLRGFVNLAGRFLVLDGLVFDGPTGLVNAANAPSGEEDLVWVQGAHDVLRRCEVRNGLWRAGVYVTGQDASIEASWIHDIGPWFDFHQQQIGGRADNIDHGVYWGPGSSGRLVNSVVEHNLAYGVQISHGAHDIVVSNNTIVRNGAGGVIWAEQTNNSTLRNNIIALNGGYTVNAHLLTGTGNVAQRNLAWGNGFGGWTDNGPLVVQGNVVADPLFVSPRDYRLRAGSPAIDAGMLTGAPSSDRDGHLRPKGASPDIGAYERQAG